MKHKPIKIDWEELEDAFCNRRDELGAFLDRVTGLIHLEGEGEEDDLDDEDGHYDGRVAAPPAPPRNDSTRLSVNPPDDTKKIEWMKAFLKQDRGGDAEILAELGQAAVAENPPAELSRVLNQYPDVRDEWYRFRSEQLRAHIDAWLAENDVQVVDLPPWKDTSA